METKRSKGITILSIAIICFVLYPVTTWLLRIQVLKSFIYQYPIIFGASLLFMVILLVCAIGVYLLKNWARVSLLIILLISTVSTSWRLIAGSRILERQSIVSSTGQAAMRVARYSFLVSSVFIVLYIAAMYFLTRPKVKEQFKRGNK